MSLRFINFSTDDDVVEHTSRSDMDLIVRLAKGVVGIRENPIGDTYYSYYY